MSLESSAPRPAAPSRHKHTVPPGKCPPSLISVRAPGQLEPLASPQLEPLAGAHDPFAIGFVQEQPRVPSFGPLGHGRVVVRVRDRDRVDSAASLIRAMAGESSRLMQSHSSPSTCNARWPMPNAGSTPMARSPDSSSSIRLWCVRESSASVVDCCPSCPTAGDADERFG
jgi:hypothetical protein